MTTTALGALAPVVARKRTEVERLRGRIGELSAALDAAPPARGFVAALHGGVVIAEMKRRSPSGGVLRADLDCAALARVYAGADAAALSVLTDGPDFGGSLDDLQAARAACALPVLRKDFVVDPVQVVEARAAGADCVLLIVAALGGDTLRACIAESRRCGVDALVEVHDAEEARIAAECGAICVGINNRDLRTLASDLDTFARVRPVLPASVRCVAESGIRTTEDAARMVGEGADAILVGETLMRAADVGLACRGLVEAARGAAQ